MSNARVFRVEIPQEHRSLSGITAFTVSEDGRGTVTGVDGAPKTNFRIESQPADLHSRQFAFHFERAGAPHLHAQYKMRKDDKCNIIVEGQVDGVHFSVAASLDGKLLEDSIPAKLTAEDQRIFRAMSSAMLARHRFHSRKGCALAGLEVIVSAFTLEPLGIVFGFTGVVAECGPND